MGNSVLQPVPTGSGVENSRLAVSHSHVFCKWGKLSKSIFVLILGARTGFCGLPIKLTFPPIKPAFQTLGSHGTSVTFFPYVREPLPHRLAFRHVVVLLD